MILKKKFDIPKHVLEEVTANIYKSTTRKATEECSLPIPQRPAALPSIIGSNKDRELYHSVYRRTGTWKTNVVPEPWERAQERPLYEDPKAKQYRPCRLRFRWVSNVLNEVSSSLAVSQWTDCIVDKILKKVEIRKFITTALKSIIKLVKLQSFVAKRCKMWKL